MLETIERLLASLAAEVSRGDSEWTHAEIMARIAFLESKKAFILKTEGVA